MTYTVELDGRLYHADRVVVTHSETRETEFDSGAPVDAAAWWATIPVGTKLGRYTKVSDRAILYSGTGVTATLPATLLNLLLVRPHS